MKIGITEVAALAQVSEATVSRVVNRRHGVAVQTREAVERAMRELGYERSAQGRIVAVVTPALGQDPLSVELADRLQTELAGRGLTTVVCPAQPGTPQELALVTTLVDHGVAAVVFLRSRNAPGGDRADCYALLDHRTVPYAGVNVAGEEFAGPVFSTDDTRAAEIVVGHLFDLGHRLVGFAAGPGGDASADRRADAFLAALARRGVPDPERWSVGQHPTVEGGTAAGTALIALGVTAIVAANADLALGVVRAARQHGLSVPGGLSVVGYDGTPATEFTDPPLTVLRQPLERLVGELARSVAALAAGRAAPGGELLFAPEFVLRASTAPPGGQALAGRTVAGDTAAGRPEQAEPTAASSMARVSR